MTACVHYAVKWLHVKGESGNTYAAFEERRSALDGGRGEKEAPVPGGGGNADLATGQNMADAIRDGGRPPRVDRRALIYLALAFVPMLAIALVVLLG